jgi:hypothetical protein
MWFMTRLYNECSWTSETFVSDAYESRVQLRVNHMPVAVQQGLECRTRRSSTVSGCNQAMTNDDIIDRDLECAVVIC